MRFAWAFVIDVGSICKMEKTFHQGKRLWLHVQHLSRYTQSGPALTGAVRRLGSLGMGGVLPANAISGVRIPGLASSLIDIHIVNILHSPPRQNLVEFLPNQSGNSLSIYSLFQSS
jgi:hypothetical protein